MKCKSCGVENETSISWCEHCNSPMQARGARAPWVPSRSIGGWLWLPAVLFGLGSIHALKNIVFLAAMVVGFVANLGQLSVGELHEFTDIAPFVVHLAFQGIGSGIILFLAVTFFQRKASFLNHFNTLGLAWFGLAITGGLVLFLSSGAGTAVTTSFVFVVGALFLPVYIGLRLAFTNSKRARETFVYS